jgi:hypothetical protein
MSALTSRTLGDLLGAPLRALIEAEAIAARTTADFIKEVGFVAPTTASTGAGVEDIGSPRLVTFRYSRRTADGKDVESTISVPLLTIVPIPSLQISEAKIDLSLIITDSATTPQRPQMKAIIASPLVKSSAGNKLTMDISVTLQQADLTHGMVSFMNLLQEGISDSQKEKKP